MVPPVPQPTARRLRVYAFDPNAALDLGTTRFASATISLAWNEATEEPLAPGPVNEYLEVIDIDPCSRQFYGAVDLDAPDVLAQDGLPPSEGDPRFHQQMVFAVAMKTIKLFERALGRKVLWAPAWDDEKKTYVATPKLRVYPHAIRDQNAYYSREKRALLFGYFATTRRSAGASWIFTALSHDIIVHETTHAILDGLHPRYSEPTSPDSLAFHEAFADIAALFSHFQLPEAVHAYIEANGGKLDESGLLSGLAGQFAQGTTGRGSLRDYIDRQPDPDLLEGTIEPHERGAILVAAVFDAFLTIYGARTGDLLRMSGADVGGGARLHPDLVARLTREAGKAADHVLRMCIRALDYLPPVDVRFGEFLRAIVTADTDLIPDDTLHYRLAFVQAFRRRGIFPENCLSMSPDNLLWDMQPQDPGDPGFLGIGDIQNQGLDFVPRYRRGDIIAVSEENRRKLWHWLVKPDLQKPEIDRRWEAALGVYFQRPDGRPLHTISGRSTGLKVEVASVRTTRRSGPDGQDIRQLVIEVTQRRRGYFDAERQRIEDGTDTGPDAPPRDFIFRGGATLIVDLRDNTLRYVIRKRIDDDDRLQRQREQLMRSNAMGFTYDRGRSNEPFAMLHRM